jgi:histidinol-phosphate aminotransferase
MSLSRRRFVQALGAGGVATFVASRGREGLIWSGLETRLQAVEPGLTLLSSNENPMGPGKVVMDAVTNALSNGGWRAGRYPFNLPISEDATRNAIAAHFKVKPENVLIGTGSTQILRTSTHVFTSKTAALVASIPTYEECAGYAELIGSPVKGVPMTKDFKLDLDATAAAAKGAGLIFYCNPNNPTATAVGGKDTRAFIDTVMKSSPNTTILVDEAYYDYVTDPAYETMIPLAIDNPRVVVARTFSKAYGMAGLRLGYAIGHVDTIKKMAAWDAGGAMNILGLAAGPVAIGQDPSFLAKEKARNKEARDFTMNWFKQRGYEPTDSQANFLFVNIKRPAKGFREACRAQGFLVARDFPPFEKTHCRISIGTLDEMKKAVAVFDQVLAKAAAAA